MKININGIEWTTENVMHGYRGAIEVLTHDEADSMDDAQTWDALRAEVRSLVVDDADLTPDQQAEGYVGSDIRLDIQSTDTGWDLCVDWDTSRDRMEMRTTEVAQ